MPSSHQEALKTSLEGKGLKFFLNASGVKWDCTVLDRNTHEKRKAEREASSPSTETAPSSSSSSSSTKSH